MVDPTPPRYRASVSAAADTTAARAAPAPVGELLRAWRRRRSLSQLDLALDAAVSSRHVSFLETGRARPSREMLLRLAEHLEVPLRDRNALLLAAGYAPVFAERGLNSTDMSPVREALARFLRAHEPYPAVVIDRHHDLIDANDALAMLTAGVARDLLEPPANVLRIALHPDGLAPRIINLGEWSGHLLSRLRREASLTGDAKLEQLHAELASYPGVELEVPQEQLTAAEVVLPLRVRAGDGEELSFFSTISTFGTAVDVTLAELAVEAFYPANARTATRLLGQIGA
jgi:transcriptional regulator with XRE-family HTH domain